MLLGLALLRPAPAQTAPAAPAPATTAAPSAGERQALQWFSMLDADGDGRISLDEARVAFRLKPSLRRTFRETDTNGDGYLTQEEIRAAADRRRAERQRRKAAAQGPASP